MMKKRMMKKRKCITDTLDIDILKERLANAIKKHESKKRKQKSKRIKGYHILEKMPSIAQELRIFC